MANRNTQGFGLIPAGVLGGAPSTGGQNKYKIDSGYATSLYMGMPVQYDSASGANVDPGYIVTAQDAITVPTIGVFNGCFFTDANTLKPTFSSFYAGATTPAAGPNNAFNPGSSSLTSCARDIAIMRLPILTQTTVIDLLPLQQ